MSKIEDIISEIEQYLENCKSPLGRPNKIICDKEEIEELIDELKRSTPEEIKTVRKIVANSEQIIERARQKAEQMVNEAAKQTTQRLSEHQIMLEAYEQADEIVNSASVQAKQILDNATMDANQIREGAMAYTDRMMADIENLLSATMEANADRFQGVQGSLDHFYQIVKSNRNELHAQQQMQEAEEEEDLALPDENPGDNQDMV